MMLVNFAHALPCTAANGPGLRAAVWVQGCGRRCPGCANAGLWPRVLRRICDADALIDWVLRQPVRGVTLSGGEPFDQARGLAALCRGVRAGGRDVVAFSGYTRAELETSVPFAAELLAETDLLVDGPYVEALRCERPLRGSSNQQLHFLTERIRPGELEDLPRAEVILGEGATCRTGFSIPSLHALEETHDG